MLGHAAQRAEVECKGAWERYADEGAEQGVSWHTLFEGDFSYGASLCILASTADFTTQLPDEVTDGTLEAECWEIIADFVGSIHFHPSAAPWESEVGETRVD